MSTKTVGLRRLVRGVAHRGAAAHAERVVHLVAHVARAVDAARADSGHRAHAVETAGPRPLLARVAHAVIAALQVAVDRRVAPCEVGLEAEGAVVVAIAADVGLGVDPEAEVVAPGVRLAVERVELHARVAAVPGERAVPGARVRRRVRVGGVEPGPDVVRADHLEARLPLAIGVPLRARRQDVAAQVGESLEPQPVELPRLAHGGLELQVAALQPLGLGAQHRERRQVEAELLAREVDARRIEHAGAVVHAPSVVERQPPLPERGEAAVRPRAQRAVEADGAILRRVDAPVQHEAVLDARRVARFDAAAEPLDAPASRPPFGVVRDFLLLGSQRRQRAAIDQAVLIRARRCRFGSLRLGLRDAGREEESGRDGDGADHAPPSPREGPLERRGLVTPFQLALDRDRVRRPARAPRARNAA